jgi:hypothetical protein
MTTASNVMKDLIFMVIFFDFGEWRKGNARIHFSDITQIIGTNLTRMRERRPGSDLLKSFIIHACQLLKIRCELILGRTSFRQRAPNSRLPILTMVLPCLMAE